MKKTSIPGERVITLAGIASALAGIYTVGPQAEPLGCLFIVPTASAFGWIVVQYMRHGWPTEFGGDERDGQGSSTPEELPSATAH